MALISGARLGPYEILGAIGAGGMGEVYRARDTRLDRTVAVKILPADVAGDPVKRERFKREARAISSLTHPQICTLYDVGEQDGIDFLVMEHLTGETLAHRLLRGSLPLEEVLRIGAQLADALDAAHRQGVIHRDLKPANVMLTASGAKILDFGLAKWHGIESDAATSMAATAHPTLTQVGTVVGTFQYMAPEQLEGHEADARSDIWAFGCVVYEMLSGEKAFQGRSQASLIGAIMAASPRPLGELTTLVPSTVDRLVRTCLAREPDQRFQSAHDLGTNLRWLLDGARADSVASSPRRRSKVVTAAALAIALCAAVAGGYMVARRGYRVATPIVRFAVAAPDARGFDSTPALAPNGDQTVAVAGDSKGVSRLWLIRFDVDYPKLLAGTEGAAFPFWSPDGTTVAFFADGKLKRIDVRAGSPLTIADAPAGRGGVWTDDGQILFAPNVYASLKRVSASGGESSPLTTLGPDEVDHRFPFLLPDGRFGYYVENKNSAESGVWIRDAKSTATRLLRSGHSAQFAAGFLFFLRDDTLVAQRLDSAYATLAGEPVAVAENVPFANVLGAPAFSVSRDGSIAMRRAVPALTEIREMSRDGQTAQPLNTGDGYFSNLELSPNGSQLAYIRQGSNTELWLYDLARRTGTRLQTDAPVDIPIWSPDGNRFLVASGGVGGAYNLFEIPSTGGSLTPITKGSYTQWPFGWTPSTLWWMELPATPLNIMVRMGSDRVPHTYFDQKTTMSVSARLSPDERWIAYSSNQSGRSEVYVIGASSPGQNRRVSTDGGNQPRWRRDGRELFYLSAGGALMTVATHADGNDLVLGAPKPLFNLPVPRNDDSYQYDIAADGNSFFVNVERTAPTDVLSIVLNWAGAQRTR